MVRSTRTTAAAALFGFAALFNGEQASAVVIRRRSLAKAELEGYDFERFVKDFGRGYAPDSKEYTQRAHLFETSLAQVHATNTRNAKEGRLWKAGVHPFMDWTEDERKALNGYKPSTSHRAARPAGVSFLHSGSKGFARGRANLTSNFDDGSFSAEAGGLTADNGPSMRNQGNCGSCWAISAAEAVEAQLIKQGATSPSGSLRIAAQALVDCVPNPQHCGGSGGCDGATGELAYSFMRDYGIPMESDFPYHARTEQCPQQLKGPWEGASPRVRVGGWMQLPSNKADPVMQAITQQGPVVVAVDGNNWFNYESGIFDDCDKDAILGHAVLAKGYGKEGNSKYWLIQNSWGAEWGENGHIRLIRHDDEDSWCGTDNKPKDGVGCDGGPAEITVCGTCGILYDPIVPTGVHLEDANAAGAPRNAALMAQDTAMDSTDAFGSSSSQDSNLMDSMRDALSS